MHCKSFDHTPAVLILGVLSLAVVPSLGHGLIQGLDACLQGADISGKLGDGRLLLLDKFWFVGCSAQRPSS